MSNVFFGMSASVGELSQSLSSLSYSLENSRCSGSSVCVCKAYAVQSCPSLIGPALAASNSNLSSACALLRGSRWVGGGLAEVEGWGLDEGKAPGGGGESGGQGIRCCGPWQPHAVFFLWARTSAMARAMSSSEYFLVIL